METAIYMLGVSPAAFLFAVDYQFGYDSATQPTLVARAREYSSFIVLVGRIAGPDLFEPKAAMICQVPLREGGS